MLPVKFPVDYDQQNAVAQAIRPWPVRACPLGRQRHGRRLGSFAAGLRSRQFRDQLLGQG